MSVNLVEQMWMMAPAGRVGGDCPTSDPGRGQRSWRLRSFLPRSPAQVDLQQDITSPVIPSTTTRCH